MQPIVVAVDFSNTSIHSIEYGIAMANKFKSSIVMVWVDKIVMQESLYPDTSTQNRNEAIRRFDDILGQYKGMMNKGLTLEYKLRKGKVFHEIDTLAKNIKAMMIIAGAHGISGFEEYWIGSNAFKIVTYASLPVITLRHDYVIKKNIGKILVPIDNSNETLQKLPFVVKLAKLYGSEVIIVTTHSSTLKSIQRISEKYAVHATQYLLKNEVKYSTDSITSNDITKSVITYASDIKADLIAIMTEQETPMNILMGPHAQELINQSQTPILSVHPQEHFCLS
ncbi:MAG: universal stress protein [Bacteroidota bacterium]